MTRYVRVTRVLTAVYEVPTSAYDKMTEAEIADWERDPDNTDPGVVLDNMTGEDVRVEFLDKEEA
jgi:hypothetical protein